MNKFFIRIDENTCIGPKVLGYTGLVLTSLHGFYGEVYAMDKLVVYFELQLFT